MDDKTRFSIELERTLNDDFIEVIPYGQKNHVIRHLIKAMLVMIEREGKDKVLSPLLDGRIKLIIND